MLKKIPLFFSIFLLALLIIFGHSIRNVGYDLVPENYNLLDERTNVWHGLSIRDTGIPAAWSDLRTYWEKWPKNVTEIEGSSGDLKLKGFNIALDDNKPVLFPRNFSQLKILTLEYNFGGKTGTRHTSIVQPYLDHPPFGVMILSSLVSSGVKSLDDLTPKEFRKTSIYLADITAVLIFILALQLTKNPIVGLISAAIYETVPTFLLTSRLALLENVFIPVNLLTLNILIFAINKKGGLSDLKYKLLLISSGIISGLAFLTKTPGAAVVISGIIILLFHKETFKKILYFAVPAVVISSFYFVWGFILSPVVFPKILVEQSTQRIFVGSLSFIQQLFKYGMTSFPIDGWWVGGFLTMCFLKFEKNYIPLIVSIVTLLFVIPFTGASGFPWYFIPFIPFASISMGLFFWDLFRKPKFLHLLILFFVFFSSSYFWVIGVWRAAPAFNEHQGQFLIYKILLVLFFGFATLVHFFHQKSSKFRVFWFAAMAVLFILLMDWNFKSILYMISNWTHLINTYSPNWVL